MVMKKNKQGFTLIELLIVIAIIGLLATLAIVSLNSAQRKARDTKRVADVKQIQNAVELYFSENAVYPTSAGRTWATFSTSIDPYITTVPQDPTNNGTYFYSYAVNNAASEYVIKAVLEDNTTITSGPLGGDDDTSYTTATSGWGALDAVLSTESVTAVNNAVNCTDVASTSGFYCVSE